MQQQPLRWTRANAVGVPPPLDIQPPFPHCQTRTPPPRPLIRAPSTPTYPPQPHHMNLAYMYRSVSRDQPPRHGTWAVHARHSRACEDAPVLTVARSVLRSPTAKTRIEGDRAGNQQRARGQHHARTTPIVEAHRAPHWDRMRHGPWQAVQGRHRDTCTPSIA